ncbi:serine hydrolase domain-containing protein [Desertimonas flava]|uniref:serine hydrolase domain-containing protein n=1 Tax=Desertimonas flava TaxID=2064846 RepID=UPI000E346132|nr:serine hydrolase [Desertimonas flava]
MSKAAIIVGALTAGALMGGGLLAPVTSPPASEPAAAPAGTFAIPAERLAELEAAGFGDMLPADYPGQPDGVPWPTQEWPVGLMPEGVDVAALQDALSVAFAADSGVDAVLAVHGGRLVLERYRDGWDPDAPHASWSMAKSITQFAIGVLVDDGLLDPFAPAPVPEWADDERSAITIDDLLRMRSGLEWTEEYLDTSDVTEMLGGAGRDDRAGYALAKPLEFEPGAVWEYSTGTSMILGRIIADTVGYGEVGTAWIDEALFAPLGITTVDHDLDATGVISAGSHIDMSARDFARFGLLALRGGEWDGEQIVPTAWVDYARLPSPDMLDYGAHWWVQGAHEDVPFPTMFGAQGFNGQLIFVIPELDAVFVILSNDPSDRPDRVAWGVINAFAGVAAPAPASGSQDG